MRNRVKTLFIGLLIIETLALVGILAVRRKPLPAPPPRPVEIVSLPQGRLPAHRAQSYFSIDEVRFSNDGRTVYTIGGYKPGGMTVWDAATGRRTQQWSGIGSRSLRSSDGKRVLETGYGTWGWHTLRDLKTGRVLRRWAEEDGIYDASPDFRFYLTGRVSDRGERITLCEMATGRRLGQFSSPGLSRGRVYFSPDGRYVHFAGVADELNPISARVLRTSDLQPLLTLIPLRCMNLSRNGEFIFGIDRAGELHRWQIDGTEVGRPVATGMPNATGIAELDDGSLFLVGRMDASPNGLQRVAIRSADGERELRRIDGDIAAISANREFVVLRHAGTRRADGTLSSPSYSIHGVRAAMSTNIAFDPLYISPGKMSERVSVSNDGYRVVVATTGGALFFYDINEPETTSRRRLVETASGSPVPTPDLPFVDMIPLPDGSLAYLRMDRDGRPLVRVIGPAGSYPIDEWTSERSTDPPGNAARLALSPDGKTLVAASWTVVAKYDLHRYSRNYTALPTVKNRDLASRIPYPVLLQGAAQPISLLCLDDPAHKPVVLTRIDPATNAMSTRIVVPNRIPTVKGRLELRGASVSPDGRRLLVAWDDITTHTKNSYSISTERLFEVRETATGRVLRRLEPFDNQEPGWRIGPPAWSLSGGRIALADTSGRAIVWNAETGKLIGRLSGATPGERDSAVPRDWRQAPPPVDPAALEGGWPTEDIDVAAAPCLAFSPDGKTLAVAVPDHRLLLYSLETYLPFAQVGTAAFRPARVRFSFDGGRLYATNITGQHILSWGVPSFATARGE